jgi:glycosyltransferase involved in cell wall biosynthesis
VKICHVITTLVFGGAEKLLADLVNIQCLTHEVHIIYLKHEPLLQSLLSESVKIHKVELDRQCASNLRKEFRLLNPDVIHTHLGHADLLGLWASRGLSVKRFCTMHNVWFKWSWKDYVIFAAYVFLFKTVARNCKVIAISKTVQDHIRRRLMVPEKNVKLLYNAVPDLKMESDKTQLRKELGLPQNTFCILFVGRLELQKSVDTLILAAGELAKKVEDFRVIIVGAGTLQNELQNLTEKNKLGAKVLFAGTTTTVQRYFSAADVFVLPSVFEGFGIVVIEAFRASLPVVATRIEGPRELIEDGSNGLLFEPRDFKTLASHLENLYRSGDLRSKLGKSGYESYLNKYDIRTYAQQIESLYRE